jgi:hypothetical protein
VYWPRPNTPISKGVVRLSKLSAPRPVPLLHRPNRGKSSTPDATHERAHVRVQATTPNTNRPVWSTFAKVISRRETTMSCSRINANFSSR